MGLIETSGFISFLLGACLCSENLISSMHLLVCPEVLAARWQICLLLHRYAGLMLLLCQRLCGLNHWKECSIPTRLVDGRPLFGAELGENSEEPVQCFGDVEALILLDKGMEVLVTLVHAKEES